MYDIKIRNGKIIDGTGLAGFNGDLGIKDGMIVAIGNAPDVSICLLYTSPSPRDQA